MSGRWRAESGKGQHGQTLVVVALAMVVVLLIAGLAIDVGVWYGQRRNMQNAADAGALAGAWEICHGNPANAQDAAFEYAEFNGADSALTTVDVDDESGIVIVTARSEANLYLSSLVLTDFTIPAVAAAQCGIADAACGMWPVAFDLPTYISTTLSGKCNGPTLWDGGLYVNGQPENSGADFEPGSQFILWADDNFNPTPDELAKIGRHCRFYSHPESQIEYKLADLIGGSPMDPGNRGWVALKLLSGFPVPPGSTTEDCNSAHNCGKSALNCWLEHGFIGPISIGNCLASQDGFGDNSLRNYASLREGDPISIILYDHPGTGEDCTITEDDPTCGGNKTYHVAGFGCVRVEHVFDGKNCNQSNCTNLRPPGGSNDKNSIFWERLELGGTDPWDIEYTINSSLTTAEVYPGEFGTNEYGFGCYFDEGDPNRTNDDHWVCANPEPLNFVCPAPSTGIVVTKLCACPPTDCVGTSGGGGPNVALNAVSLIPVPSP
jgi:hypothetical protein